MIEIPIDNPKRVKEIFMNDKGSGTCTPVQAEPTRAVESQLAAQQDFISELHSVISVLGARLEKVTIPSPTDECKNETEREELSNIAGHIRTNNDSIISAFGRIRRLTDEIEL